MFGLFQYPKAKHKRSLNPRDFRRYQSYKSYLQVEFSRLCVYCRQPDSSSPNLNFGVDHYRPKGNPKFKNLECSYSNLYYCCGNCNSRKNNAWPDDEAAGPFVVNPCDFEMASHMRFNARTGGIEARSPNGAHTIELLQLNDGGLDTYRVGAIRTVQILNKEVELLKNQRCDLEKLLTSGNISQTTFNSEAVAIDDEIRALDEIILAQTGKTPTKRIHAHMHGLPLVKKP